MILSQKENQQRKMSAKKIKIPAGSIHFEQLYNVLNKKVLTSLSVLHTITQEKSKLQYRPMVQFSEQEGLLLPGGKGEKSILYTNEALYKNGLAAYNGACFCKHCRLLRRCMKEETRESQLVKIPMEVLGLLRTFLEVAPSEYKVQADLGEPMMIDNQEPDFAAAVGRAEASLDQSLLEMSIDQLDEDNIMVVDDPMEMMGRMRLENRREKVVDRIAKSSDRQPLPVRKK